MLYLRFNMPHPNLIGKRPMLLQVASFLNKVPPLWQVENDDAEEKFKSRPHAGLRP